jgi:hypothetical protein
MKWWGSKWGEALYSLIGTQKELLWLDICPILFLPSHHLNKYIRKLVSTYEKVTGEESGTCIEWGWQQRRGECMLSYIFFEIKGRSSAAQLRQKKRFMYKWQLRCLNTMVRRQKRRKHVTHY